MKERTLPVLSRRDVEISIAQGHKLFILDQFVIKADAWLPYHPGGEKSILHMVGRDATDEVTAFVSSAPAMSSLTDQSRMPVCTRSRRNSR